MRNYQLFSTPKNALELGCWSEYIGEFQNVIGHTNFGDFFVQNPDSEQIAILYTISPELFPTNYTDIASLIEAIESDNGIENEIFKPQDTKELIKKLGELKTDEVFIPNPYPFLGGNGELSSYDKGNVWVFVDLVGQLQDVA